MVQIEITKQPFYGTVYWNGDNFIYTPTPGFSGNDVFYYTKIENGVTTTNKKYVSTNNQPPIARTITLSADAYYRKTIDITELIIDQTNPFNDLKIVKIDNPVIGRIQNNGTSLYYFPNAINTVENLDYVVSDKEYYSTGTLILSVTNGRVDLPLENTTFKYKLEIDYNLVITIPPLTSKWESAADTLSTYKDIWTNTDVSKYVNFSNYVESTSTVLNQLYNNIPIYDGLYVAVESNSALWIRNRSGVDFVKNNENNLKNVYSILTAKNTTWNNDYNNYSSISSIIDTNVSNIDSMNSTVAANAATTWDSNELYNALENPRYDWNTSYNILSTLNKNNEWNNSVSATSYIIPIISSDFVDFTNLYNIITANSAIWSNQDTENIMTLSDNWNNVYLSDNDYNNLYTILTSNSGLWINDRSKKDLIYNLLNTNSANWNNLYDILTGNYGSNWISSSSLNYILSNIIDYNNSVYSIINSNSGLWNDTYINGVSANLIDTYNTISSLSDSWNNLYNNFSIISTDLYKNLNDSNSFTNLVSTNSAYWNEIINFENSILLSTVNWNYIFNNKGNYNNLYTILSSNSSTWYSDVSLLTSISSFIFENYSIWNNMYSAIVAGDWLNAGNNYDKLALVVGENNVKFNNLYNVVTANSGLWDDTYSNNYLNGVSANLIDTYNTISSLSDSWNNLYNSFTSISTDLYKNLNDSNSFTNLVSTNSAYWNEIINFENSISLSTVNWNAVTNSKNNYDNLYTILSSNSSTWYSDVSLLTSISSFIINNYQIWETMYSAIVAGDWLNAGNNYDILSSAIGGNNILFNNLYNLVTANSTKWASVDFYNTKLSAISSWDSTYDTLITKNKYISWNNAVNNLENLSAVFYETANSLNALNTDIQNSLFIWDNKIGSTVLSGNSANWANSYSNVTTYSAGWDFNNKPEYSSTYSYVTANSARLNNTRNNVITYSATWNDNVNNLTPVLINQFLTGSDTINLSTFNLSVIRETYIKGNLSALGGRFSIDTTLNTTSGFLINNDDSSNAVNIDKVGGGAIFNAYMADSPVLYVKATPRTVGVNLSAVTNTIDGINNISLTVSGNISASGYVYPFPEELTIYSSKSAAYESAYSYVTANSAAIDTFISDTKPVYDSMVSYINAGNISSFSAVTIPYYNNNYLSIVNDYSNKITQINNYQSLCDNVLDIDNLFSVNSSKYEQTYNYISTVATGANFCISHYFGGNSALSPKKVNVVVQDNIRIQAWQLYTDNPGTVSMDILSTTHSNFGKVNNPVSITNNNLLSLTTSNKNSASNLSSIWSQTYLPKGSILQFNLINASVSGLLINLTVQKQ